MPAKYFERISEVDEFLQTYSDDRGQSNSNKTVCNCPFCLKHGETTMKPKLYYYKDTKTFYCFRCSTFASTPDSDISRVRDELSKIGNLVQYIPEFNEIQLQDFKSFEEDEDLVNYIKTRRHSYYIELMKFLQVKAFIKKEKSGHINKGLFFPFFIEGKAVYHQTRFIDDEYFLRYKTKKFDKIPYKIIDSVDSEEITLVEGVFDALGAYALRLPNPIAMLGKDLSEPVLYFIKKYIRLKVVYLALDDVDENFRLAKYLFQVLDDVRINICEFSSKDPDQTFIDGGKITNMIEYDPTSYHFIKKIRDTKRDDSNEVVKTSLEQMLIDKLSSSYTVA